MCCNVSDQSWMNSIKLAEENVRVSLLRKLLFLSVLNFVNHWSRKNYFNHCLIRLNSFQRLQIDVQLKPKEASFKHRCHVRIWSKWRHIFSLFWWTGTLLQRKWSERTYLRDKQSVKRNIQVMVQEIAPWNLSDAWRRNRITTTTWTRTAILLIFTDRIESLRSEAQLSAGKKIFNVCQFKLSS